MTNTPERGEALTLEQLRAWAEREHWKLIELWRNATDEGSAEFYDGAALSYKIVYEAIDAGRLPE